MYLSLKKKQKQCLISQLINLPVFLSFFFFSDEPAKFINKARGPMGLSSSLKGDLELSCEVSLASAVVVWKKDKVEINEDQRTAIISKGTQRKLVIKSAKKNDEGYYSCETAGDKVTFHVKIKGKAGWQFLSRCRLNFLLFVVVITIT